MALQIKKWAEPLPKASDRLCGLVEAMRKMKVGEYVEIPAEKRSSAYSCARAANVKVATKKRGETVSVVRVG